MTHDRTPSEPETIGWREWVGLPDLGVETIKAKVDTGARTSSMHAFDLEEYRARGRTWVRFMIHPEQRSAKPSIEAHAQLHDRRRVMPSSGHAELRPVILTAIELLGRRYEVELTLTNRDAMGFRMLLGRQALKKRFVVDPGRSYLNGRRVKGKKRLAPRKPKRK